MCLGLFFEKSGEERFNRGDSSPPLPIFSLEEKSDFFLPFPCDNPLRRSNTTERVTAPKNVPIASCFSLARTFFFKRCITTET